MRELWFEQNDLLHLRQWCRLLNVPNREWHRVHISDSWNPSSNLAAALPPKPPPPTAPYFERTVRDRSCRSRRLTSASSRQHIAPMVTVAAGLLDVGVS